MLWTLRGVCVLVLAVAIGLGCSVESGGLRAPDNNFRCTASLRSAAGAAGPVGMADSSLDPYTASICGFGGEIAATEWRRRLFEVISSDPSMDFSCAEDVVCGEATPLPEGSSCPPSRTGSELPECPPGGAGCLTLSTTAETRVDPAFDLTIVFPATVVGGTAPPESVIITNACGASIRLIVAEELEGRDRSSYSFVSADCAPDPSLPDEMVLGKSLGVGESCVVEFHFEPVGEMGFYGAHLLISQDTVTTYRVRLYGTHLR